MNSAETKGQMALAAETAFLRDMSDRHLRKGQESSSLLESGAEHIAVNWHAHGFPEKAAEMCGADTGATREGLHGKVARQILMDRIEHCLQAPEVCVAWADVQAAGRGQ